MLPFSTGVLIGGCLGSVIDMHILVTLMIWNSIPWRHGPFTLSAFFA